MLSFGPEGGIIGILASIIGMVILLLRMQLIKKLCFNKKVVIIKAEY